MKSFHITSSVLSRRLWIVVVWLFASSLHAQGYSPEVAVSRMAVAEGFEVQVVAAEPLVRQPVCIEFDDRGRLWVIQYLQYPNPEGLKRTQVDRYSRTKYDRVPDPPPRGPRGADRITILEDSDGDGRMDRGRDFVEGLNLTTGLAFGHGGVFVLNAPYLLFYPDRDRDDVPDGDPDVLLSGFGMEDAHSVANSLTWGPDGWLYGCQGSTVTANVRGIEFQQGVWRYHPTTRAFELFCEGGGNSWGLDFDRTGNLFYSTNYGGHVLLHGLQGAYYVKSFAKHGELHNPHSYGYFDHAAHTNFRGGHVTVGGIVYQGELFPETHRGRYIAGDLLGHGVYWHDIIKTGSTVTTSHGGELLVANDSWFAPTDVTSGPDGAVYVSDWHDSRTAHPDPDAYWDRSNGRIYRIAPKRAARHEPFDLAKLRMDELIARLGHPDQWHVRRARQEISRRAESKSLSTEEVAFLEKRLCETSIGAHEEATALEALWTLATVNRVNDVLADELLNSPHSAVRTWAVRLLGDKVALSPEMAHRLDKFAEREPSVDVRLQLACTAARLPAHQAMPIINANINRDIDNDDPRLPLMWWWAVEKHSVSGRDEVMKRFVRPSLWKSKLGRSTLLSRLVRRYAAEGTEAGVESVVKLLRAAPDHAARGTLWESVLLGWQSRSMDRAVAAPTELIDLVRAAWSENRNDATLTRLGIAIGLRDVIGLARQDAFDRRVDAVRRASLLDMLAPSGDASLIDPTLATLTSEQPDGVRRAALRVVARFDEPRIAKALISLHHSLGETKLNASANAALQSQIRETILGRKGSAREWLLAVDRSEIAAAITPLDQIRRVTLLADAELNALVTKHWGRLESATREDKLAEVRRLNNDLRAAGGDAMSGREVFKRHCAACHTLFNEGTKLGPDLTTANRKDRDFLLISLVDPSSVIRKEYVSVIVQTKDGRVLTGLPTERSEGGLTLVDAKNQRMTIALSDIEEIRDSATSMMPDDLYRKLTPQELRDLFTYLQRNE